MPASPSFTCRPHPHRRFTLPRRTRSITACLSQPPFQQEESIPLPSLVLNDDASSFRRSLDETWPSPHRPVRHVVALGKFNALHRGHYRLALAAATLGLDHDDNNDTRMIQPWLFSFQGLDRVLGRPERLSLVAPLDRPHVLYDWSKSIQRATQSLTHHDSNTLLLQRYIPFELVREMSPEEFVLYLKRHVGAWGVVAGSNYRFGHKAIGTADSLKELGNKYGLRVEIVNLVTTEQEEEGGGGGGGGVVSSTRTREALARGEMNEVAAALGRRYRLLLPHCLITLDGVACPLVHAMNQPPGEGEYVASCHLINEASSIVSPKVACRVVIQDGRLILKGEGARELSNYLSPSASSSSSHILVVEF